MVTVIDGNDYEYEPNKEPTFFVSSSGFSGSAVFPSVSNNGILRAITRFSDPKKKELPGDLQNIAIEFIKWQIEQHKKQVKLQSVFGIIIFCMVILLTLSGIVFSGFQLFNATFLNLPGQSATEIGINNLSNFYIKTTVVGGLVLFISVVFFFLFLQYLYKTQSSSEVIHSEITKAKQAQSIK
ncbi:MAG: hypothetical protein C0401_05880 [Anaerolinea sp.]|nr:hypothetical protein [Anaerolinea sp.]